MGFFVTYNSTGSHEHSIPWKKVAFSFILVYFITSIVSIVLPLFFRPFSPPEIRSGSQVVSIRDPFAGVVAFMAWNPWTRWWSALPYLVTRITESQILGSERCVVGLGLVYHGCHGIQKWP